MNPGIVGTNDKVETVKVTDPTSILQQGNSNNHAKVGQEVLYGDGHVEFQQTPFCGPQNDNIFTTHSDSTNPSGGTGKLAVTDTKAFPLDINDSSLVPADDY